MQVVEVASLTDLLRELMRRERLTAPQLAERSGVNVRTLNSYLQGARGKRGIPAEAAVALFGALGVPTDDLALVTGQLLAGKRVRLQEDGSFGMGTPADAPPMPRAFREMMHEVEREAHRMGATIEDFDYVRAVLADPETMSDLFNDEALARPLTSEEQLEEIEALRDELLGWLRRRVELRAKRRRRE